MLAIATEKKESERAKDEVKALKQKQMSQQKRGNLKLKPAATWLSLAQLKLNK